MLNRYSYTGGNINNSITSIPSGILMKTHPKSYFRRYHLTSKFQESTEYDRSEYVVLQSMIVGDMEVLSEIVKREYFEQEENYEIT